jgi:hypothetical protein
VCEVPVHGYDGELTSGYMTNGAIPTFKIYDASENTYIDAITSEDIPWENMGANFLETLMGCSDTTLDECGVCGGGGISEGQCDCVGNVFDCAGICDGEAVEDNCGVCDNDSNNNCEQDCSGTWGGPKVLDECGVCGGDGSSCIDCCGVPNGNGTTCNGDCGPCNESIPEGACDCDGNVLDECGVCGGDGTSCQPSGGPNFSALISVSGEGGEQDLTFGFSPGATDGFDDGIDMYAPPAPPPPAFDAALTFSGERYYTQILNGSSDDLVEHEYRMLVQYRIHVQLNHH